MAHKDVEYHVSPAGSTETKIFRSWGAACNHAVTLSLARGPVYVDIVVYSRAGAKSVGLVDAWEIDPDASVLERIEVNARSWGTVP